ncbi:MAG: hypothetical protein H6745_17405 [Deltaproteobacteria bacterium]|nr:hypothetical protein [Deltaproteobacteria bacterium]
MEPVRPLLHARGGGAGPLTVVDDGVDRVLFAGASASRVMIHRLGPSLLPR